MSKKEPLKTLCIKLPPRWMKMLDHEAARIYTTRTQIVKSLLIDFCLRRATK